MKNYKAIIIGLGLTIGLSSCDMDLTPLAQGNSESWYTTELELQMAVNEFYVMGYWNNPVENSEQWTDNFTYRDSHRMDILYGTLNSSQWEMQTMWHQYYKLINRANTLLEKIDNAREYGIAEDKLEQFMGEAHMARACKYAELIFFFGDVVKVEKYMTLDEAYDNGRTSKDELIPWVYEDFDLAARWLPAGYGAKTVHFTKGAAYAMKARFALWMGDWEVAAKAAKNCMDLNVYELHGDFAELFLQNTRFVDSKEKIFSIPRSYTYNLLLDQWLVNNQLPRNAGGFAAADPSWDLLAAFLCTDGLPIDESPLFDPREPFVNRDPRCTKTIVEFETEHVGFDFNPHPDSLTVKNYTTGAKQPNNDTRAVAQYASYNGLVWKKGIDATWLDNGKTCDRDYDVIRYADVLLMYAEAKIELNEIDDSVLKAINMVRARGFDANVSQTNKYPAVTTTDQAELRKTVRLERRVELANEALRYYDLIRWRLAGKALNTKNYGLLYPASDLRDKVTSKGLWFWAYTPQIDEDGIADFSAMEDAGLISALSQRVWVDHQYLWPIPLAETQRCPNIKQNTGY